MKWLFIKIRRWIADMAGIKPSPMVSVLRFEGVIDTRRGVRGSLNLASVAGRIEDAFDLPGLSAVAVEINSPGGLPVQSELILERVRDLAREKEVPVLAFCEDVAASGGYMLALAGDEIYAQKASIIGSIGVISAGFGFQKAIEKLGIDRRVYTAGDKKVTLDPFSDENPDDVKRLKKLQTEIHDHFIALVKKRRGKRLEGDDKKLFNGEVFTGQEAVDLGLIDEIGSLRPVLMKRFWQIR